MAEEMGISHTSVQRIWAAHGLKPHLVRSFKISNDPDFVAKVEDIVGLYVDPPEKALVLSIDEKSQIRALFSATRPAIELQGLTETCGISVEDHPGRSVRDCVPALAEAFEGIVGSVIDTGDPVFGIEVAGQRADQTDEPFLITYWRSPSGEIVGVNVAAEEITERNARKPRRRQANVSPTRIHGHAAGKPALTIGRHPLRRPRWTANRRLPASRNSLDQP